MSEELVVLVTTPDEDSASQIGTALVEQRLAACVNIIPAIHSIYRWEGQVTRDRESLMIIKTTAARYEELERKIKELHKYSTPEVIAFPITQGSAEYLKWVTESTV
jgi:periplasmic divalent cation tolerance protein